MVLIYIKMCIYEHYIYIYIYIYPLHLYTSNIILDEPDMQDTAGEAGTSS